MNGFPLEYVTRRGRALAAFRSRDGRSARPQRARNQDIQFASDWSAHLRVIFLRCVQNSIDEGPVISPCPNFDSLIPPNENGSRGTGTPTFTPIIPAFA